MLRNQFGRLLDILNANRKIRKRTNTDVAFTWEYSRVSIFHRERECTNYFWWKERKFPESSIVDLRIKNYFKDYLYRDIRALTIERDEKGARKV